MKAIGIDIGTTSICGVVFDTETGETVKIKMGDYFFLPFAAEKTVVETGSKISVAVCLPGNI